MKLGSMIIDNVREFGGLVTIYYAYLCHTSCQIIRDKQ